MKGEEKKLLKLFERLAPGQQETLIAFAEFLTVRVEETGEAPAGEPVSIERPANETVTMAIRRLVRAYPMLDRRKLMAEASRFMAQHALEGRAAHEVIDELEVVFSKHYEEHKKVVSGLKSKV